MAISSNWKSIITWKEFCRMMEKSHDEIIASKKEGKPEVIKDKK